MAGWKVAAVSIFIVALLGGVWFLESRATPAEEARIGEEFAYQIPEETQEASHITILVRCIEEKMDGPSDAFSKYFRLEGIPLEIPGGPLVISRLNEVNIDERMKPAQRAAIEVLKRYGPDEVVLVSHFGCIYYDTEAAWVDKLDEVRTKQVGDIQSAGKVIKQWFPEAMVFGYVAEEESGKMIFRPVGNH